MRQSKSTSGERIVKEIKRKTRKQYSAEEKIRIVLDGHCGPQQVRNLKHYQRLLWSDFRTLRLTGMEKSREVSA